MKTLQKEVQVLYRFRCERCRSKFEMMAEKKRENDIKFTDNRYVRRGDMHRYHVMDDGTEIMDY